MAYHSTSCITSRHSACRDRACHCVCHDNRCEVLNLTTGVKVTFDSPITARNVGETMHEAGARVQVWKDRKLWLMLGSYQANLESKERRDPCPV